MTSLQILKEHFHLQKFRPGQKEIIDSVLAGKNVLAVMPTGAGKSLCYQIPALMNKNFSIVISPLISLMQDQVDALNKNGISAAFINSSLDYSQTEKVLQNIANKKIKLLYLAPERLSKQEFIVRLKNMSPYYLFIDEAHCISEWGHNFRPSYRNIRFFAEAIKVKNISAFTATATPEVRTDIVEQLGFKNPSVFIFGFERENISLIVENTKQKKERVLQLLNENDTSTIIYTSTRKDSEKLSEFLKLNKINAEYYHGGLTNELRRVIQDDFLKGNLKIIVATNAFGMGIDKQNIGLVIHYNIPGSIENLYQEFGRVGRNGDEAKAYLLYSNKDKYLQEFLISVNHPTIDQIRNCYDAILDYHRISVNSKSDNYLILEDNLLKLLESKSINQNLLNSILNSLQISNYLEINGGSQFSPKFKFLLTQNKLKAYVKKLRNTDLKELILTLVKLYGSKAFTQNISININKVSEELDLYKNNIKTQLRNLEQIGIIEYEKQNFSSKIKMLTERIPSKNLILNYDEIKSKIENAKHKLKSVVDYSFTEDCRFKFILNYFGENADDYKCNKCDNCLNRNLSLNSIPDKEYLNEIIIRTLKEFNGGLTFQRLVGIITGKSKSYVAKLISTYQSCSHYKTEQIEYSILDLANKKIIKKIDEKYFFDPVEELFNSELKPEDGLTSYESNLELFNRLREERNIAAKKFSQHPEIICSDKILREIANVKPNSPSSLLSIKSFNQRMFNKIGMELLEIINEFNSRKQTENDSSKLPQHILQTYELVTKGYSLAEISNLIKLPESIVSLQIETIISYYPNNNYDSLIPADEYEEIKVNIFADDENLKEIKKRVQSNISYAKIRIVKTILFAAKASLDGI